MILVAILFVVLGALIKYGKMYFLIAGYNTMPKEEKAKYDAQGIANVMWNGFVGMALLIAIGHYTAKWLGNPPIERYVFFSTVIIGVAYIIIKANSGKYRIDRNQER